MELSERESCAAQRRASAPPSECCTERYSPQFKNNCLAEMWSGSEEGSYLRLTDCYITQL